MQPFSSLELNLEGLHGQVLPDPEWPLQIKSQLAFNRLAAASFDTPL